MPSGVKSSRHARILIFAPDAPHRPKAGLSGAELRCVSLPLFQQVAGQPAHQTPLEAGQAPCLLDDDFRLLRPL